MEGIFGTHRVALVADGPALFAGIAVGALDIYSFEFVTSKYATFADHIGSYDGKLTALAAGALGGTPSSIGSVAHGGDVPAAMTASADAQERQRLFDTIVTALGIGLRKHNTAVSVNRLTDANGTFGFGVESPEPISLTRDVTLTVIKHILVWVPGPGPGPGPLLRFADVAKEAMETLPGLAGTAGPPIPVPAPAGLSSLVFDAGQVTAPAPLGILGPGDLIARIAADRIDIYDQPVSGGTGRASGTLRESMSAGQAAQQLAYASLAHEAPGTIIVLKGGGGGPGPIQYGHWEHEDLTVVVTALTNGDESKILILSDTPLGPGDYTLQFVLDRDRWPASSGSDPEQHYHDQASVPLSW